MKTIKDILTKEEYSSLTLSEEEKEWINGRIKTRSDATPGVECIKRGIRKNGDYYQLTEEEIIRQCYAYRLLNKYGYSLNQLEFELPVIYAGKELRTEKYIDIAVYNEKDPSVLDMIIECKRPSVTDVDKVYGSDQASAYEQMRSYCKLSDQNPKIGAIVNGANLQNFYESPWFKEQLSIDFFPANGEDIDSWKENRRYTIKYLLLHDKLKTESLKDIVLKVEQRFAANESSEKAFDEIFKLIFAKLYDEKQSQDDLEEILRLQKRESIELKDIDDSEFNILKFRVKEADTLDEVYENISTLFSDAKDEWPGVFPSDAILDMSSSTVKSCVKELQDVKLFNSNLDIIDDAFEHLVNLNQKGVMGQFFTPRYVIDMCVKMLNPQPQEKMIDTAAGSCGFPMHTTFHVWQQLNPAAGNVLASNKKTNDQLKYVRNNVFGIDFSERSVMVGRMLNIIAGDGHTNVIHLNTLDYANWKKTYKDNDRWRENYTTGFSKLVKMSANPTSSNDKVKFGSFNFDILMANPPFAGDINIKEQLKLYKLAYKPNKKLQNKVGRDILFIERNLNFLKPGGRMAIVLPQGRFNNSTDKYIRDYITENARVLAVVGLHVNTFKNGKSGTSTKTSVLFLQKWTDEKCGFPNICPKPQPDSNGNIDYPIFFATMQEPSKNNSGDKIYVTENYVRWTSYKYITEKVFIKKSDNRRVSSDEYDEAEKKSDYKVKAITIACPEEHRPEGGQEAFIRDLFVAEKGALESLRRWIPKNIHFVLKKNKMNSGHVDDIDLYEYLDLDEDEKKCYKEVVIYGENNNGTITKEEYDALDKSAQKYFDVAEEFIEYSERVKDTNGHYFVRHDLFNHDPLVENLNPGNVYCKDGIAEAFMEFAKKEGFSFF